MVVIGTTMGQLRQPQSKLVREGLAYWNRIRGHRPMPARADMNPLDIPQLLPYVMLVDVLRDPLDFRFRLLGSAHDEVVGADYRGRLFSALPHTAEGNPVWAQYAQVVAECVPICGEISYVGRDPFLRRNLEHCLMPLSADGVTVNMILVVTALERRVGAGAPLSKRVVARSR